MGPSADGATASSLRRGHVLAGLGILARRRALLLGILATFTGFAFAARSLVLGVTLSSPVPTFDSWAFVDDLVRLGHGDYGVADLFGQQNEHRIVTARLHFFLDYYVFHLGNLSVVLANYGLVACLAALLTATATRGRRIRVRLAVFALTLGALWSAAGWINLVWSFQIQWAYVHLMSALAIVAFALAGQRRGPGRRQLLALACLCDALGVYSMSSGLVTVVPVVAVAVWTRSGPRLIAAFVLCHIVLTALFFWDYEALPQDLTFAPAAILRYLAPYLGTAFPVSETSSTVSGAIGIVLALVAMARATAVSLLGRRPLDTAMAALLGIMGFVLVEGLATAVGRAGMPNPTALALRYANPSEVFWAALTLCVWRWLHLTGRRRALRAVTVLALCGVVVSNTAGGTAAAWALWSAQADNEGFNMINGVRTDERGMGFDPLPETVRDELEVMRVRQIGPFAEDATRFKPPLNSLSGLVPHALDACAGVVDQVTVRDGRLFHLQGWAMRQGVPLSSVWALAMGPGGRLLGYARTWQRRIDTRRGTKRSVVLGFDFWFAGSPADAAEPIDLVAVFPGGTVPPCRLPLPDHPTEVSPADIRP